MLALVVVSSHALRPTPQLVRRPLARVATRAFDIRLSDDVVDDMDKEAAALRSQRKKLEAERLALQAEKAALEAEQIQLELEQLKLATAQRRKETDASGATTPAPVRQKGAPSPSDMLAAFGPPPSPPAEAAQRPAPELQTQSSSTQQPPELADGQFNTSRLFEEIAAINATAPPLKGQLQIALELAGLREPAELCLSPAQVERIKDEVFDLETYYTMKAEDSPVGTIFRGNLRADAEVVFPKVQARLANASAQSAPIGGVAVASLEGVQLLLIEDPLPLTLAQLEAAEEKRPVFLAVGPQAGALKPSVGDYVSSTLTLFAVSFTTLGYALSSYILTDEEKLFAQLEAGDTAPLEMALPIALGLGALQLLHELAHAAAASRAGVKLGAPVPLPSLQLGLYGCVTRLLSFPPNRAALFDVAVAGPLVAGAVSLALYVAGLSLSAELPPLPAPPDALMPVLPTALRHGRSGRLGGATAGLHGLLSLHLKAWGCSPHS